MGKVNRARIIAKTHLGTALLGVAERLLGRRMNWTTYIAVDEWQDADETWEHIRKAGLLDREET